MNDIKTQDYFDNFTPHYNPKRFDFALNYLNHVANEKQTLLDIGCGDGATLHMIREATPIKDIVGLDISKNYLERAMQLTGCGTIQASILNEKDLGNHIEKFDYCVLGAVLHHLVGSNRGESFKCAKTAMQNAAQLLRGGGDLIVFEPTHSPSIAMTGIFWLKKGVGLFINKRVELSARWVNIGQPVVSYYTPSQLYSLIPKGLKLVYETIVDESTLGFFIKRKGIGLILQKEI